MARERVGTAARDFAPFLQVSGRPDPQRFPTAATAPPSRQRCGVGSASQNATSASAYPSGTRQRASARSGAIAFDALSHARSALRAAAATAAQTSATCTVVEAPLRSWQRAVVVASARPRSATPPRRPHRRTVRCAPGSVGPNRLTVGVPTAVAMWSGPVSPDTRSADARASATRSAISVRRRFDAPSPRTRRSPAAASNFFAGPPQDHGLERAALAQERRELAEALRRPPLVRPRGAGIDQCERPSTEPLLQLVERR